ncbi:efflux RND transporter periplasmic adaptor subunit [Ottowia sp. VDI28]|uniref:efflux RND transporter periplasmic adaptor subunit n=1 Tax=Ottowia sp. VDI28 TaxID=3133968 RepID=UPI003C2ACD56
MKSVQLLCAFALATLLAACGGDKKAADAPQAAASAPRPVLTITAEKPQRLSLADTLSANGSIAAWQEASIGADVPGLRLADVRVNVGDVVKKGQVLATYDAAPVRQDEAQARASLAEAEAAAADAAGNAERARAVASSGALSQQQINQYLTAEKTARARADAARAVVASQGLRLRNAQVLAPDDGVISARPATVGQVSASGTELFRLVRRGRLEWRAEVTAEDLARVHAGQSVQIELPGGAQVAGTVRQLAPTVDAKTRYGLVYVDLPPRGADRARPSPRGKQSHGPACSHAAASSWARARRSRCRRKPWSCATALPTSCAWETTSARNWCACRPAASPKAASRSSRAWMPASPWRCGAPAS